MMPLFSGYTTTGAAFTGKAPPSRALFRHYRPVTRGVNVFILNNGTVTEAEPVGLEGWAAVSHALWGGHLEPITSAEASLLTAAGYGAYIS